MIVAENLSFVFDMYCIMKWAYRYEVWTVLLSTWNGV